MLRFLLSCFSVLYFSSLASAANFWLSTSGDPNAGSAPPGSPGGVPAINHPLGTTTGSIYIWARPDAGKTLANWSLNLISTNPSVLSFDNSWIEPFNVLDESDPNTVRWEQLSEPGGNNASVVDMKGFSLFSFGTPRLGVGVGPQSTGVTYDDRFYDSVNDAWLLAQVDYTLTGVQEQTDLYLQIGSDGLNNFASFPPDPNNLLEDSSLTSAILGATSDPALNAKTERETNSATADASIALGGVVENANFNGDAVVDARDFLILQRGYGLPFALFEQGDANIDGQVNGLDLGIWEQQYGGPASLGAAATQVPEPSTSMLVVLAATLCCLGRRTFAVHVQ